MIYSHLVDAWEYDDYTNPRYKLTGTVPTKYARDICQRMTDEYDENAIWTATHTEDLLQLKVDDCGRRDSLDRPPRRLGLAAQSTTVVLNLRGRRPSLLCGFCEIFRHLEWIPRMLNSLDHLQSVEFNLHVPDGQWEIKSAERLLRSLFRFTEQRKVRSVCVWSFPEYGPGRLDGGTKKLLASWGPVEGLVLHDGRLKCDAILIAESTPLCWQTEGSRY